MSLVLNVEILGEFKKLTSATQGAAGDLQTLSGKISGFASSANKIFASIGIGLGFKALANGIEDATKAAIDDRKSQALLANAMKNTAGATDAQVAAAEEAIAATSKMAGIADDELRPAYQKLFIATGSVSEANRLLGVAVDAAAGSGKGLDTVSQAMAKSLAGSDTALGKLIPSLKDSKTPIDDLATAFNGSAAAAAKLDPYQNMQVKFGEIQEQIGTALLPALDKLLDWLNSPKGEETIKKVTDALTAMLQWLGDVATWAINNGDWLAPLITGLGLFGGAWKIVTGLVNGTKTAIDLARKAQELFNKTPNIGGTPTGGTVPTVAGKGAKGTGLKGASGLLSFAGRIGVTIAGVAAAGSTQIYGGTPNPTPLYDSSGKQIGTKMPDGTVLPYDTNARTITNNVTINNNNGTLTGSDLTSILNKFGNNTGTQK